MRSVVYVNGGIVIETPYFRYLNAGAKYDTPPMDIVDIIEPDEEIHGHPCLIITEKKAPTFFKGYYAKTFFSSRYEIASFFKSTVDDIYDNFNERIQGILDLISQNDVCNTTRQILYRLALVGAVAAIDTYVSELVLFVATKDKEKFLKTAKKYCKNKASEIIARIEIMWRDNTLDSAEQNVIDFVLKASYSNINRINDDVLKKLYNVELQWHNNLDKDLDNIFTLRHIIVHRSGKRKNGTMIIFDKSELLAHIDKIQLLASSINEKITDSDIVKQIRESKHYAWLFK